MSRIVHPPKTTGSKACARPHELVQPSPFVSVQLAYFVLELVQK